MALCDHAPPVSPIVAVAGIAPATFGFIPTLSPLLSYTASVLIHRLDPANQPINFRNDVGVIVYQAVSTLD